MTDDARPDGISAEDLSRWDSEALAWLAKNSLPPLQDRESFLESYRAGEWLDRELTRLGDDAESAFAGCFALGQIEAAYLVIGRDQPWAAVRRVLDARAAGLPLLPGPTLGAALIRETLGVEANPEDFPPMPKGR